jgi:hypothetical protein
MMTGDHRPIDDARDASRSLWRDVATFIALSVLFYAPWALILMRQAPGP